MKMRVWVVGFMYSRNYV